MAQQIAGLGVGDSGMGNTGEEPPGAHQHVADEPGGVRRKRAEIAVMLAKIAMARVEPIGGKTLGRGVYRDAGRLPDQMHDMSGRFIPRLQTSLARPAKKSASS